MKNTKKTPDKEQIWRIIFLLGVAGAAFLFLVSIHKLDNHYGFFAYLITLGTALLIAGACFSLGALTGFLFGIPRIINNNNAPALTSSKGTVIQNDNLVQISDWLTKIIVGVGLTQINEIPNVFNMLGRLLGPCFEKSGESRDVQVSAAIAISIVVYFLILGFIACYLWTRFHFSEMLEDTLDTDEELPVIEKTDNPVVVPVTEVPAAETPKTAPSGTPETNPSGTETPGTGENPPA